MKIKKNYYFTFGSSKQFPFQNGYIVVKANDVAEFRETLFLPNRTDQNTHKQETPAEANNV